MPFTLAHPAAVMPFARLKLPLSALVIGCMAPDFPYFFHLSTHTYYGHSMSGLFWFCIPVGLLGLFVFHALLKLPLLSLLSQSHQERLFPLAVAFRFGSALQFLKIVLALLLGACTHVVWDSFTHANGWTVQHVALLRLPVSSTSHGTLYVFKVLQHGSTVVGIALLSCWYHRWFKSATPCSVALPIRLPEQLKRSLPLLILLSAFVLAGVYSFWIALVSVEGNGMQVLVRNWVVFGVAFLFVEMLIFSVIWHIKAPRGHSF